MKKLFEYLKLNNLTLSSCESFTGGYFANQITNISGASQYFKGSFICYSDEFKTQVLGIDIEVIKKYSVVSREVLALMLEKTNQKIKSDIVIGFTGYAPPKDVNEKSGLSFVGFRINNRNFIFEFFIEENISREDYKQQASEFIINKLLKI
ncbi:CinA family protein [Spiroplasma cantharicola]|uniref:Competence damage-inducible protein A n=1 Tax=Spiroplasma cantharicola TaxID=362837 RepID=A0A0M4JI35_9MOLU|nr:nicotinamide-nucleotide amidohydrolase family protein [Spiroplasma cantharicola]ALD66179.1 competence damage-inducible protein A [Spiroplasma cantharicola]